MRTWTKAAAGAFFLAALAPNSARADVRAFDPDLRCAAIGFAIVGGATATDQQRNGGMLIAAYYVGRLQGRNAATNLEEDLYQLTLQMTPEDLSSDGARCGAEFEALGRSLMEMGADLQQRLSSGDAAK